MCNMLSIAAPLLKLITLIVHRKDFFYLILYLQRKFLHGDYDDYERNIVLNCKRKCTFFTCSLTFTTLATVVSYIINPLVGKLKFNKRWIVRNFSKIKKFRISLIIFAIWQFRNFFFFIILILIVIIIALNLTLQLSKNKIFRKSERRFIKLVI